MRRVLSALPLAAVLLGVAAAPGTDSAAAAGGFRFVECLTGKRPVTVEPRTPREGGCKVTRTVALTGALSFSGSLGVARPRGIAISGDGHSLFVASPADAAIDRFRLGAGGGLRFAGCLTGARKAAGQCARVHAKAGGPQRLGFEGFSSLAVAGHDLYASASGGSAVSRFSFP